MKRIGRVLAVLTVVAVAAFGLAGCGDDDSDDTSDPTASTEATQPSEPTSAPETTVPSKGTIKVGTILPIDTPGLSLEPRARAVEAGIEGFNARGGVGGWTMEWVLCDSKGDPNTEVGCARQMVEEGVVATLADSTTANTAAVDEILQGARIARIGMLPAGAADYVSPIAFPMYPGPVGSFGAIAKFVIDEGRTNLAIFVHDQPAARALPNLLEPAITSQGGRLATTVFVPAGATDYSQFIAQAQSAGADGALMMLAVAEATQIIKAATQLNWDVILGGQTSTFDAAQLAELGELAEQGVYGDANPAPTDSVEDWPALEMFLADMKALDAGNTPETLNSSQVGAWLSVVALVEMMKDADRVDAATVLETLNTVQDVKLMGLQPPWTPSNEVPHEIFQSISNPFVFPAAWDGEAFTTRDEPVDAFALWPAG